MIRKNISTALSIASFAFVLFSSCSKKNNGTPLLRTETVCGAIYNPAWVDSNTILSLHIRGKSLKIEQLPVIYIDKYFRGSNQTIYYQSDTIFSNQFTTTYQGGDTALYKVYQSKNPLPGNRDFYRLKVDFDYVIRIPKISKKYVFSDFGLTDTTVNWKADSCGDSPYDVNVVYYYHDGKKAYTYDPFILNISQ